MATAPDTAPRVPGLEVERRLGRGTMADVYLAREPELDRYVALKVLRADASRADPAARERFDREARAVASLTHPNIVTLHRYGHAEDGRPFLVMQHVKGRSLAERLAAGPPLPADEARAILIAVAEALEAAHRRSIVHRDVRPANVLLDEEEGRALLTDFGIARSLAASGRERSRLTATGQLLGDPRYRSPEQLRGEEITEQTDVYELGVLGYEMLTKHGPYGPLTGMALAMAHQEREPLDLAVHDGVDPALARLLCRCLAKDPTRRPTTRDVARSLRGEDETVAAGGASRAWRALVRRRVPQWILVTTGAAATVVGVTADLVDNERLADTALDMALVSAPFAVVASGVVAWFHGTRGRQQVPGAELWMLTALAVAWAASVVVVVLG